MKIIIIGGKGTAINIAEQIMDAKKNYNQNIEFLGFAFDDRSFGSYINGYPILCNTHSLNDNYANYSDVKFIYSLYKSDKMLERSNLQKSYGIHPEKYFTFIHPSVYVSSSVRIGLGNVILSHSSVLANVSIGNFNIINSSVIIEHDTQINNNNFIAAKACIGSNVRINNGVFTGLNSTIRENVSIGNYAFIGMGANVLNDVDQYDVVVGNPAKKIRTYNI